jgi:hypothetical protein
MTMRFLFALLAVLVLSFCVSWYAQAQGTDTWSCSGDVTVPAGTADTGFTVPLSCARTFTPPPDNPPTVANLSATCDEEVACAGDIGAADDNGFVVSWGVAPGVFIGNADGSWSWQTVDGDGLATYGIPGEVSDGVNPPVLFTLQVTVNDTVQAPPPPAGNLQDILNMPAGSWLAYGDPWSDLETSGELQQVRDNCNILLSKIVTGWQGLAFDGRYFWNLAGPGHGDGCFNGIVRYDLETAQPEVALPHLPLNMPICWGPWLKANGTQDCYYEPYATTTPAPICATTSDPNCGGIPLQDRLDAGLSVWPTADAILAETEGQETFGAFLRPRSSHDYNNTIFLDGYVYLMTGQTYGGIRADGQVWRFAVTDPAGTLERLPNRWNTAAEEPYGGYNANLVSTPGGVFMFSGGTVCEADMVAGTYDCAGHPINVSNTASMAWDEGRQGIWAVDSQFSRIVFYRQDAGGSWAADPTLGITDASLSGTNVGRAGICLVPTDTGANPVIWGTSATLLRWDGTALTTVTGQVDQPATASSTVLNKWRWNADLGVCLGLTNWDRGVDAWRPDFSNWQEASLPPPDPDPQPGDWPVFAGHTVAPAAWTPAAWNAPIERQPEAPDYDALCPGPWATLDYRTDVDLAGSAAQMRGLVSAGFPNVRVYLHPREDAAEPYSAGLVFDKVTCGEVVGVPANGNRPTMTAGVAFPKIGTGLIARGIDFQSGNIGWACHQPTQSCPVFTVLHDNRIGGAGLLGDSDPALPTTYLELRGNIFGPNLDWHGMYLERSIGQLVALSNVFHASGNAGHALKNLANYARIEGNVFSNVDIDGQPLSRNGVDDVIGLFPLDHYACTDSIIRNNTIVFRTSGNVATLLTMRGRNAWGNCDKGQRLADGSREVFPPESVEYLDGPTWDAIGLAAQEFANGYAAASAEPWLFTHLIEGNTFIVFEGKVGVVPYALTVHSMRPIADNTVEADLKAQLEALLAFCTDNPDFATYDECWFASASEEVLYVRDHIPPSWHDTMMHGNGLGRIEVPNSLPIRAPSNWVERTGVFWDEAQTYIACNADGTDCAERGPYSMDIDPAAWDDVPLASPPRVIALQ